MDNLWFSKVFNLVYTKVKAQMEANLSAIQFNFTSGGVNDTPSVFPTVYIAELPGYEIGRDIDNRDINAIEENIRIYVYSNKGQTQCKKIMMEAVLQMKALRFNITSMPLYSQNGNVVNAVATFSRVVGRGDTDMVIEQ
jgi:hypothetical protein